MVAESRDDSASGGSSSRVSCPKTPNCEPRNQTTPAKVSAAAPPEKNHRQPAFEFAAARGGSAWAGAGIGLGGRRTSGAGIGAAASDGAALAFGIGENSIKDQIDNAAGLLLVRQRAARYVVGENCAVEQ